MDDGYKEILKEWEDRVADPVIFEHIDELFPSYAFRRVGRGGPRDHWASRYKLDLTLPRTKNAEKTVIYPELRFREQGDFENGVKVIDKIIDEYRLGTVYDAYCFIAQKYGLDMPKASSRDVVEAIKKAQVRSDVMDCLMDYFCWNLENNGSQKAVSVRAYLKKRRGISQEQASRLCLGFVPDWSKVVRYVCVQKKFPKEVLDEVCCVENEDGYTAVGKTHVLSIPYECGGELKGFLFRRVDGTKDGPKYIANANLDRKSVFFNMAADRDPKQIVIVEGEMDALKATAEGVENVVAIGGSEIAGERRRQVEDAFRRGVDRIILCLDLDPMKDNPAEPNEDGLYSHVMKSVHTIKDVAPSFEEIYVVRFPEISDPDEYIRNHGVGEFLRLLDAAEPYWEYVYGYNKARRK